MKKSILSVLAGTVLLVLWSAGSWIVLPFHSQSLRTLPENITQTIGELESGVYHYPGLPNQNTPEATAKIVTKLKSGPRIPLMVIYNQSSTLFDAQLFLSNIAFSIIAAFLTYLVLRKLNVVGNAVLCYTLAAGGITIFIADLPMFLWYLFPPDYIIATLVDRLVSFLLLGLLFKYYTFKIHL